MPLRYQLFFGGALVAEAPSFHSPGSQDAHMQKEILTS